MSDPVNSPSHYTFGKFEVIDVLEDWFPHNPLLWQVGKYISRAEHKGDTIQDLCKAAWYLNREIERLTHDKDYPEGYVPRSTSEDQGVEHIDVQPVRGVPQEDLFLEDPEDSRAKE